jgi:lysozyme
MAESVLKSFVVSLGFKINDQQFRNFNEGLLKISKGTTELLRNFKALGEATALSTTAIGASLVAVAKPLESMYYLAQRTGASAKEIDVLGYSFEQLGMSAETAGALIDKMAQARRTRPGLNGILGMLGVDPGQTDNAKTMVQLITQLRNMDVKSGGKNHYVASQYASMFGVDEATFKRIEDNFPTWVAMMQQRQDMLAKDGYDPQKSSVAGVAFMRQFNEMKTAVTDFAKKLETSLMPIGITVMGWIKDVAIELGKADTATGGWSTRILALALSLKTLSTALSLLGRATGISGALKGLGKVAGIGGGAAEGGAVAAGEAGAGVAAGEATAGAGGLMALIGPMLPALIPLIVGAAVIAAVAYVVTHPAQVRKAMSWVGEKGKEAGHAIAGEAHALPHQVMKLLHAAAKIPHAAHAEVDKIAALPEQFEWVKKVASGVDSLAKFTANFEGHVKNGYGVYKDIAGNLTAGYGHLVKQGEDFSHLDRAGALALLAKDLGAAVASVSKLVKVKLSKNQQDALADFVFNVGKGNLAKSTLLKKLNSGDFAGAANEFERYNKVLLHGHYVVNQGLANRRAAEAKLFSTPDKSGVQIKQETNIHVTGGDAKSTGREVAQQQSRVNGDMVRNFASAVQ